MAPGLRDKEVIEDLANRGLDTAYLSPILQLADLESYAGSFPPGDAQRAARNAVLFPASALRSDLLAFLASPRKRIAKVREWRQNYANWLWAYPGRSEALPQADKIFDRDRVLGKLAGAPRDNLRGYFETVAHPPSDGGIASFRYRSRWFGDIAAGYAGTAVPVGVFLIPRGPYHAFLSQPAEADGALASLAEKHVLRVLPPDSALALEHPEFFFDQLHLNAKGRGEFSARLARAIVHELGEEVR
jgi:hypothetical protein